MIGGKNVVDALCNNGESFPTFILCPCGIRLEILCSEVLPVKHVSGTVTNIVNSIRPAPLQHRLLKQLSENVEPAYPDLICTEVRWPSKGKVLELFKTLVDEVKAFLESKNKVVKSLLTDLPFFGNVTQNLNILDFELQGRDKLWRT